MAASFFYGRKSKSIGSESIDSTVARDSFGASTEMSQCATWTPPGQSSPEPISVTHTFAYNTHHQLCLQTSPQTGTTAYGYDAAGNLTWRAQGIDPATTTRRRPALTASTTTPRSSL